MGSDSVIAARAAPVWLLVVALLLAGCGSAPDRVSVQVENSTSKTGTIYVNVTEDPVSTREFRQVLEGAVRSNETLVVGELSLPVGYYNLSVEFLDMTNLSVIYTKQLDVDFLETIRVSVLENDLTVNVILSDGRTLPYSPPQTETPTETFTRPAGQ